MSLNTILNGVGIVGVVAGGWYIIWNWKLKHIPFVNKFFDLSTTKTRIKDTKEKTKENTKENTNSTDKSDDSVDSTDTIN